MAYVRTRTKRAGRRAGGQFASSSCIRAPEPTNQTPETTDRIRKTTYRHLPGEVHQPAGRLAREALDGDVARRLAPLPNGETVWAVFWVVPMPDLSKSFAAVQPRYYKGASAQDLQNAASLKALVFGEEADGSRVFWDVVVQRQRPAVTEP